MYDKGRDGEIIAKMEPTLTERFAAFADEVERTVPASGKFQTLYATFEDATRSMDIVHWSMTVRDLIYGGCDSAALSKRYLELIGYLGGEHLNGYCIKRVVGYGSVAECAELLRSKSFVTKVMDAMRGLLANCGGV